MLRLMRARGLVLDAVSLGEMERAFAAGASVDGDPAGVVLTCDALDRPTLERVVETGIEVNAGSIDMLRQLGERSPATACGSASTRASAMATAARPTPAAKTASTASGTRAARGAGLHQGTACTWWACTCTWFRVDYQHLEQVAAR
jgi:diaminopimelate decarboxylase